MLDINQTVYQYLKNSAQVFPQPKKLVYFGRVICAEELFDTSESIGGFLEREGLRAGDAAAIMLPNIPQAVFAFYGASSAGVIAEFADPRLGTDALFKQLKVSGAKVIFILPNLYRKHRITLKKLSVKAVICPITEYLPFPASIVGGLGFWGALTFKEAASGEKVSAVFEDDGSAPAVYFHSGGTAGEPKTVIHSGRSLNGLSEAIFDTVHPGGEGFDGDKDSMLMMLPLFHAFGLGVAVHTVLSHVFAVMLPRFRAKRANALIKKYRITHLAGVPAMYKKMLAEKNFRGEYLSCIKQIFCGGDRLNESLRKNFNAAIADCGGSAELLDGYGLTETASVVSVGKNGETKPGFQGKLLVGNRGKSVDATGNKNPAGVAGEIWLSPVSVMSGYLADPEGTAAALQKDEAGRIWLRTGDIGSFDGDGFVKFSEREKRSVKIGGKNIFPCEIESVCCDIPWVKECCAARMTDGEGKAYIKLFVATNGQKINGALESDLKRAVEKNISPYAVPRQIEQVDVILRTPFAKVDFVRYEKLI